MAKDPVSKTFSRIIVSGRRYSRAPDPTPPSAPTLLQPQALNSTAISIGWVYGTDPDTGIASARVEISVHNAGSWTVATVAFPTASYTFTGLAPATSYDIRVANTNGDATPVLSAYSAIQTLSTPASAAQLEPGQISLGATTLQTLEGTAFQVTLTRSGAGSLAPSVEADYVFEQFSEGTPTPATGTVSWSGTTQGNVLASATAGSVLANRTGRIRITAVRALSGNLNPSIGTGTQAITIVNQSSGANVLSYVNFEDGIAVPNNYATSTNCTAPFTRAVVTTNPRMGTRCLEQTFSRVTNADFRVEIAGAGLTVVNLQHMWYGFSVYLNNYVTDTLQNTIFQVHQINFPGAFANNPPVSFHARYDGFGLTKIFYNDIYIDGNTGLPNRKIYNIDPPTSPGGPVTYYNDYGWTTAQVDPSFHDMTINTWYDFVFHFVWDPTYPGGNGLIEVWKKLATQQPNQAVKVINIAGAIGYGDGHEGPQTYYPKVGNYKAAWKSTFTPGNLTVSTRHDELRFGTSPTANFLNFMPGQ